MKKPILALILVSCLVFFGLKKANAAVTTVTFTGYGNTTTNLSSSPQLSLQNSQALMGFTLTGSGGTTTAQTVKSLTFATSLATNAFNNAFFTTATLWSSTTSSTFSTTTASPVAGASAALNGTYANIVITPTTPLTVPPSTTATTWYFIVIDYTKPSTSTTNDTWQLTFSSGIAGTATAIGSTNTTGFNYVFPPLTITAADVVTGLNPAVGSTIYQGQSGLAVAGISLKMTTAGSTANLTSLVFGVTPASTFSSYFTAQLYSSTSATFSLTGGTPATAVTTAVATVNASNVSFAIPSTPTPVTVTSTIMYYYLVLNYSGAVGPKTFTFTPSSYTSALSATAVTTTYATNTYNCGVPGPYVLTLSSLTNAASTNGLSATPVPYGSTNYSVYGFSLAGSGTVAGTSNISSLTFNQTGTSTDPDLSYYTTASLYQSTTSTYVPGTTNVAGNLVASTASVNNSSIVFNTAISASNATNMYYFIVLSDTKGDNNTLNFKLTYASSVATGTAITPATGTPGVAGPAYTFAPVPPTTVTFNSLGEFAPSNGMASDPISTFQTGLAFYGFTLAGSGSGTNQTISSITFNTSFNNFENNNTFFPMLTLYSSTNPTFPGVGGAGVSGPLGSVTLGANTNNFTLTPTTPLTVTSSTAPVYYFLVIDYTTLAASYTYTDYEMDEVSITSGTGAAVTVNNPYGYDYTFSPPTITATDITTGLSPVPPANIFYGQSNLAVAGIGLSISMGSTPLTSIVFSSNQTRTVEQAFFGTTPLPQLYVSTSSTFSLSGPTPATLVSSTATVAANGTITFPITTQTITTTPLYYYMVINYSVNGTPLPTTFQFAPSSYKSGANGTATTGFATNSYTCSPPVYVALASTNGFPAATIPVSQPGIPVLGFSVASNPSNTFTTFNFTTAITGTPAATIGTFFANPQLYSSTTNDFTTATPVTDPGITFSTLTSATTLSITGLNQNITGGTVYYFLVFDYTAPAATYTFKATFTSMVNTAATTFSTAAYGFPVAGTTYTLKQIAAYTYYWWGNGATTDWRNPNNWTTKTDFSGTNAGAYPGSNIADNAIFNYDYWDPFATTQAPTIGAYNVNFNTLTIDNSGYITKVNLTVNSADSLTVATLVVGSTAAGPGGAGNLVVAGTSATGTLSAIHVTGSTSINYNGLLSVSTNGVLNFTTPITLNGTNGGNQAVLNTAGGTLNVYNTPVQLLGTNALISNTGGTMSYKSNTLTFSGTGSQLYNNSATGITNLNGATVNVTGTVNANLNGLAVASGSLNIGPYTLGGVTTNSVINLTGTSTSLQNTGGTVNINAATVNLGTTAINGSASSISNTGGTFYLNAGSTINMTGPTTAITNSGGVFVAGPTSFINPTSTTATINNSNAANYFTLLSDATGSATIGQLGVGAKMTGQYNVQRYISIASRNYRLLSSATNSTAYTPGNTGSPNQVNVSLLGTTATIPTTPVLTFPGAFTGGPAGTGGGFTATTGGPLMYLYQESIVPSLTNYNASFYSGKNIAITALTSSYVTTTSTANAVGGTGAIGADNASTVIVGPGNGYLLYYIHDNTSTSTTAPLNAAATTASGFVNQGTIPLVLWGQSGFLTTSLTNNGVSPLVNPHAFAGLTMVGNPYPSSIDLQRLYTDNIGAVFTSGTNESFSELDPANEQFATYGYNGSSVTTSGSDASRYIASGQGFYITVQNPNQVLTFYEDQKTTSTPALATESIPGTTPVNTVDNVNPGSSKSTDAVILPATNSSATFANSKTADALATTAITTLALPSGKAKPAGVDTTARPASGKAIPVVVPNLPAPANTPPPTVANTAAPVALAGLHLKLVQDSLTYDECGLYFTAAGSDKFDKADAMDMDGVSGKVYLSSYTSDHIRTAINSLGGYTSGKRVPLFVKFSTSGIYKLQLEDIANFNSNYSVFLIDNLQKDSLDLTLYKSYNFNYGVGTANDSTRFVLAIEHKPIPHYALLAFAGQKVTQGVLLNWKTQGEANTTTFVLQKLTNNAYTYLDSLHSDSAGAYSYVDQHPIMGNNTYRLQQTDGLGNVTYSAPVNIGYNSTTPNGDLTIYPNPTKSTMTVTLNTSTTATEVATVDIYNISGVRVEHKTVNSNTFVYDASSYKLGVYIVELKNSNGDLVGKSKFVKVQ